jgi:predicted heme/steroid binding protein
MSKQAISFKALSSHNTASDAWLAINGTVYDIRFDVFAFGQVESFYLSHGHRWHSKFKHPGGQLILKPYLGRDASEAFKSHHNVDILSIVQNNVVGVMDTTDPAWLAEQTYARAQAHDSGDELTKRRASLPPLATMLNTRDLQIAAGNAQSPLHQVAQRLSAFIRREGNGTRGLGVLCKCGR